MLQLLEISTPDDIIDGGGLTRRTASVTLSTVSPPESTAGRSRRSGNQTPVEGMALTTVAFDKGVEQNALGRRKRSRVL